MYKKNLREIKMDFVDWYKIWNGFIICKLIYFEILSVFWIGFLLEICFLRNYWLDNLGLFGFGINYSRVGLVLG